MKAISISGLILAHFWQSDVPMTQMGGRIIRPVTDEEKNIVTCFLIYCIKRIGLKPETQVYHRVLEDILLQLLVLLNYTVYLSMYV